MNATARSQIPSRTRKVGLSIARRALEHADRTSTATRNSIQKHMAELAIVTFRNTCKVKEEVKTIVCCSIKEIGANTLLTFPRYIGDFSARTLGNLRSSA